MLNPNAQKFLGDLAEAPPHLLWVEKKGREKIAGQVSVRSEPPPPFPAGSATENI